MSDEAPGTRNQMLPFAAVTGRRFHSLRVLKGVATVLLSGVAGSGWRTRPLKRLTIAKL
jgi:hypothetical protein